MNILITGGAGFIGRHLQQALSPHHKIEIIDIKNGQDINKLDWSYTKPDVVIHLAAEANLRAVDRNPQLAVQTMTTGLLNCLEIFGDARFIYFSSSMVYGDWPNGSVEETTSCSPKDLYGQLKYVGEGIVKKMHNKWIIIRPSAVYGPDDDLSRVIPKWVNNVKTGKPIEVRGDSLLDFTHIDDLVQAVKLCLTSKTTNEVFNITRGKARSLMEAAVMIVEHMGEGSIQRQPHNANYPKRGTLDCTKAKTILGYDPTIDIEQGIKNYIDSIDQG